MNRSLRRQLSKQGNIEKVVAGAITETQKKIEYDTCMNYTKLVLMVLHDKFGFGEQRVAKFHRELAELSECISKGLVSIDDIGKALKTECKVNLGGNT